MSSFELYVAVRYLLARRKQAFISQVWVISTFGLSVGVMATIIALALMTGLQQEMRDRILGSSAHVFVWKVGDGGYQDYESEARRLSEVPNVIAAAPAILGRALATTRHGEAFITVKGIDPELEEHVTEVADAVTSGSLFDLDYVEGPALGGIVLGEGVAQRLGAYVGDEVLVVTPSGTLSPMGMMLRRRRLKIVGLFSLGLYEFDTAYGFVTLDVAERLTGESQVEIMELRLEDIYAARQTADDVATAMGPAYLTMDWTEMNESLFSALWLEKVAIAITIGLIVIVAALNIVASLVMLVMEKSRDIAILKTMGAGRVSIRRIFMLQGLIIGVVGTSFGAVGGYVLSTIADRYRLIRLDMEVYQIAHVPFTIEALDFVLVIVTALVVCFLATVYPSRQAVRLDPAEALRYE